jgi:MFS family permease
MATVLRSAPLLRTQVAYLLFAVNELAAWVAILVYAYDQGGATASGLVAFVQLAPAVVFAPLAATIGERLAHTRLLAIAYLVLGMVNLAVAALLLSGQPPLIVYLGAVAAGLAITVVRPAHAAVMPDLARTPSELTAANVASGTTENLGVIAGSIGGGLLLASIGPGGVFLACAMASLVGFGLVATLRVTGAPRVRPAHVDRVIAGPGSDAAPAAPAAHTGETGETAGGLPAEMIAGLRIGLGDRLVRPLIVVIGLSFLLQGAADVLMVVFALEAAGMGEEGVGALSGAIGIGGLLGAAAAFPLVGKRLLLGAMLVAAVVAGGGMILPGLAPLPAAGLAGFVVIGIGRTMIDITTRTMLQRVTPPRYLTRVFGLVEGTTMAGLAVGSLLAPLLVWMAGPSAALVVAGLLLPAGVLLLRGALRRSEAAGVVHERELAMVRRTRMLALLPLHVQERLAAHAVLAPAVPGENVVVEGDAGDSFYMIESGELVVTGDGRELNRLGPGDVFGEVALLYDIPRSATVTAVTDAVLFALDREPFLEALVGQSATYAIARQLADERLANTG